VGTLRHSGEIWCHSLKVWEVGSLRISKPNLQYLFSVAEPTRILCEGNLSNVPNVSEPDTILSLSIKFGFYDGAQSVLN